MRLALRASLLLLLVLLAACDCGGYPAGGPDHPVDPPGSVACVGIAGEPVPLHDLATGPEIRFHFSACGHLLATIGGADALAGPDLAALQPLPVPDGWGWAQTGFSPTGELLYHRGNADNGTRLVDFATGVETVLGPARSERFLPSHDLGRSILRRCTGEGLTAVDRGVERTVVRRADCERDTWFATFAPVEVAVDSRERLLVADLERRTVLDTGLPFASREEETPSGEAGYRADLGFLSADGTRLLHAKRWQVFRDGGFVDWEGPEELRIVEVGDGVSTTYPVTVGDPVVSFFRSGFVWQSSGDKTHFVGAGGHLELDARCDPDASPRDRERVMLRCHHGPEPTDWHLRVVDTRDFSTVELGAPWSMYELSSGGAAAAGCPNGGWLSGSCAMPTIRRWRDGDGVRDLPLDRTVDVVWVGDDGAVLAVATERDEALFLDRSGVLAARFPLSGRGDPSFRVWSRGGLLLLLAGWGGSLELLDPETGFHKRLAEQAEAAAIDAGGQRIAFTVHGGDGLVLHAGAVARTP